MRKLCAIVFIFLGGLAAQAQFNDSTTRQVRLSASGNLNRSNSTTAYLLANEARFSIRKKHTTLNTAASWLYGAQNGGLTNNDFSSTTDFNLYQDSANLYYWALANFTTSYSLRIRNQWQAGLGVAYNFINTPKAWLNLSEGILYETSHLNTAEPSKNQYHTFRNSLRLAYRFVIKDAITLSGTNFHQPALGNGSDYIVRTSNSLGVKLNQWISIATTVTYNRFSRTGAENLLFTYGLVAERFF